MEQAIWLYVGVISALFALAIVGGIVLSGQEQMREQDAKNAIGVIQQKANLLCASEVGTLLTDKITLPSGSVLSAGTITSPQKVCVWFKGTSTCLQTKCDLSYYDIVDPTINLLDLNTEAHKSLFQTHEYACSFEKQEGVVKFGCKG
jgi:hypothetical protein